jgi:hypothetical protein
MSRLVVGLEEELAETLTRADRRTIQYTYCCQKDTFAYFGPAALMCKPKGRQVIDAAGTTLSSAMVNQMTMLFPIGAGGASLDCNSRGTGC